MQGNASSCIALNALKLLISITAKLNDLMSCCHSFQSFSSCSVSIDHPVLRAGLCVQTGFETVTNVTGLGLPKSTTRAWIIASTIFIRCSQCQCHTNPSISLSNLTTFLFQKVGNVVLILTVASTM